MEKLFYEGQIFHKLLNYFTSIDNTYFRTDKK